MTETVSQVHIYANNQAFVDWLYPEHGNADYPILKVIETISSKDFSVITILEDFHDNFIGYIVYNSTDTEFMAIELNKENVHIPVIVRELEIITNDVPNRIILLHDTKTKMKMSFLY